MAAASTPETPMALGAPLDRVDGPLKVCGQARYAAEFTAPRLAHAVMVTSTVAAGRVRDIDTRAAEALPGVLMVITHRNAMRLPQGGRAAVQPPSGRVLSLLQDDRVHHDRQPVAVVVAERLEQAQDAALRVHVQYDAEPSVLDWEAAKAQQKTPAKVLDTTPDSRRGDPDAGWRQGAHRVEATYGTPMEHHHPMEPHATLAWWDGDQLSLHDSTQHVAGVQRTVAKTFGLEPGQVRVQCPFTGGGFGGKGSAWSHVVLAAMAARQVGRPVRLVVDRTQMAGPVGGRPRTEQRLRVAADAQGRLTAIEHRSWSDTSVMEDWTESAALSTRSLYACDHVATAHRLVPMNVGTPTFQRAPGEATGLFALESALDELAHQAGLDPVALRLASHADRDPEKDLPFSSKSLRQCYQQAAEAFGWSRRHASPGTLHQGPWQVGLGMASATRPAKRMPCAARVRLQPDGWAVVQSSTEDLGTGTYTAMTQVAADALGWPVHRVRMELGDTRLPDAPISAGSMTVESVGSAVVAACLEARRQLAAAQGGDPAQLDDLPARVARHGAAIEAEGRSAPGPEDKQFSMNSFGAVFVEAHVDRALGIVRVPRVVGAYAVGRVINEKTARSQLLGGLVWGISMALLEESQLDPRTGRFVNANLSEYHVPVNADIGEVQVILVPEHDPHVNPLGAKGLGEVSMTGTAAAVANAVFNATGRRVRELPITLDRLLG